MNNAAYSAATPGRRIESSSLVTDSGLVFPGAPNMHRSTSFNNNMRIPAPHMSFSSNNINMPGSSVLDGSTTVQTLQQTQQQQQEGASSAPSLPIQQMGQSPMSMVSNSIAHVDKKPRIEVKQEDMLQQQQILQLLQRQDPMGRNPQLQVLLQQRMRQQQLLQSMTPSQRLQLQQQQQQQQQQQLRQQLQQQGMHQIPPNVRQYEGGVCARRLMMYLYHQQLRPSENAISYWRKFVAEYYSPRAKQRLCLSQYESAGHHALGMFPQGAPDMWHCDLCGAKSGKGFEATFEALARLIDIKFGCGITDELLYLDYPRESRLPSGLLMLEYRKAVQESIHEQFRVVREGHLRIIFTQDLKILSWEFCARRHEELLLRRVIAPRVNQFLQAAQKCQSTISESGSQSLSQQDLQTNSNMVLAAGRNLAKCMEFQSLNDLGYPKRYIRTLQIAEVVKSMKDLMDFTRENKIGPIEGLKQLSEQTGAAKLQRHKMQEMEQLVNTTLNGQMSSPPGVMNHPINNNNTTTTTITTTNPQMVGRGALSGSAKAALALTNYQSTLMRHNAMNNPTSNPNPTPNPNAIHQDVLPLPLSFSSPNPNTNPNPNPSSSALQRQNLSVTGFSSPHLSPLVQHQRQQQQQQPLSQRPINATGDLLQQNHHHHHHHSQWSQGNNNNNQALQQNQMIQQLIQEISNNSNNGGGMQQQSFSGQSGSNNGNAERTATPSTSNISGGGGGGAVPSRNNSFKAASNSDNNSNNSMRRAPDLAQNLHLAEDISVPELPHEFTDDGFFNNDDLYGL